MSDQKDEDGSKPLKTARHERFAQGLAKGLSINKAYQMAGYKPNHGNAGRMNSNEGIQDRVKVILSRASERAVAFPSLPLRTAVQLRFKTFHNHPENDGNRAFSIFFETEFFDTPPLEGPEPGILGGSHGRKGARLRHDSIDYK